MKPDIHPEYVDSLIRCACGNEIHTRSTKADMHVDICSNCHPFFTGEQRIVDTAGRVERFRRRYARTQSDQPSDEQAPVTTGEQSEGEQQAEAEPATASE